MSNPVRVRHDLLERNHGQGETLLFTTHEKTADIESEDPHREWDDTVARAIGRVLHTHYRGHAWNVWVSREQGIAKIWISVLMNPQTPYVLKLTEQLQPGDVMRAGGELLERFGIPRSAVDFGLVAQVRRDRGPLGDRAMVPGGLGRLC
jgi:hypothetical protein